MTMMMCEREKKGMQRHGNGCAKRVQRALVAPDVFVYSCVHGRVLLLAVALWGLFVYVYTSSALFRFDTSCVVSGRLGETLGAFLSSVFE